MNTELRKRLEEAAENYVKSIKDKSVEVNKGSKEEVVLTLCLKLCYTAFITGSRIGYEEAIKVAKEWLDSNSGNYLGLVNEEKLTASTFRTAQFITDFEADMNKLWEEKK